MAVYTEDQGELQTFEDLRPNGTYSGLLGSDADVEALAWIIPVVLAIIIFLFLAAYGLYHVILSCGDWCFNSCYKVCGCCAPKKPEDHEERIRLLDYSRPVYESSTHEDSSVQML